jgi:heme/copper-type cytochrome/quinol oxidase subunit 2
MMLSARFRLWSLCVWLYALAAAIAIYRWRGRRPEWYLVMLAACAALIIGCWLYQTVVYRRAQACGDEPASERALQRLWTSITVLILMVSAVDILML